MVVEGEAILEELRREYEGYVMANQYVPSVVEITCNQAHGKRGQGRSPPSKISTSLENEVTFVLPKPSCPTSVP